MNALDFVLGLLCGIAVTAAWWSWRARCAEPEIAPELDRESHGRSEVVDVPDLARVEAPPVPHVDVARSFDDSLAKLDRAFARFVVAESATPLHALATGIGRELADLATAVQGNAQLLCEVAGEPELVAVRCESLWAGVDRLRLLTEKILTFARDAKIHREPVEIRLLLDEVKRELETAKGDLVAVQVATSPFLPPALADRDSLYHSILFLVDTLLELEPCTHSIAIAAYADVSDDVTTIGIEICAESDGSSKVSRPRKHALELGYLAAQRSLEAQGAQLWFQQVEDVASTCFVTLEADLPEQHEETEPRETERHEFGGVLVLEDNPSIRSMVSTELERLGRKIFSCVDAASARALLEATPERFELLILEQDARNGDGLAIARDVIANRPETKTLILGHITDERPGDEDIARLQKPFGLLELRAALNEILAPV
ncbi:MAG: hypothetical protein KDB80_08810 [Planctomycetes bacterium]|nr:hypothetical protein [Planctomycetota bacterium]